MFCKFRNNVFADSQRNLLMNTKQAKEIVPPEPHSTGPDFLKAWNSMPRWLQLFMVLAFMPSLSPES